MNKFEKSDLDTLKVKTESDGERSSDMRVVKLDNGAQPMVQQFHFGKLQREGQGSYETTKAKFGVLSATDPERHERAQRDRRFAINPLLREPLSIEQEERRAIDQRVEARIAELQENARTQAHDEGYKAGLEQGHKEAYDAFARDAAERLRSFEALLSNAETAKQEIFKANERFVMEVVFRVVRMLTLKELSTDREYVARLARELIERSGARENIRIRINPEDLKTAELLKPGLEASLGALKNVVVEASPEIKLGGCAVETQWNAIDASLETQLQGIHEALTGASGADEAKTDK